MTRRPTHRRTLEGADTILVHQLRTWGTEYRRIMLGGRRFPDGTWQVDGWPAISISGRLKDQAEGAAHVQHRQHFAEVYSQDALAVRRAMVGMSEQLLSVVILHYVVRRRAPDHAKALNVSIRRYWELLTLAHTYLQGALAGQQQAHQGPETVRTLASL